MYGVLANVLFFCEGTLFAVTCDQPAFFRPAATTLKPLWR
jgi:hypothetical protein